MLVIHGCKGCGNVVIEAICRIVGEPFERREVEPWTPSPAVEELRAVNPNLQVPTVVTEDGLVMTESVAIALWLIERHPEAKLAPKLDDPQRGTFLRWLVYVAGAIYPMYVVGDFPARFVSGTEEQQKAFKGKTNDRIIACWKIVEEQLQPKDWLIGGETMSALDVFAAVMTRWRPGREKIREAAPRVIAAAEAVEKDPRLTELFAKNF
jgi:GST-like protein